MSVPQITKEKIVVVATREENQYGDILFTDKEGQSYKIGVKRKQLGNDIVVGYAVKLQYAVYAGKEYIAGASLVKNGLPPPTNPQPVPVTPQSTTEASKGTVGTQPSPKPQETVIPGQQIGMTVKEIGDMIRTDKLSKIFGLDAASNLITWYRGQILGTTRVNFDGAKLPKFTPNNP